MQIALSGICFHYHKGQEVLRDIGFELAEGKALGLLGHNGSGKSTLLKLLGLLRPVQAGSYLIDGKEVQQYRRTTLNARIGLMIESPGGYGHLTVSDNLRIFAHAYGITFESALQLLERVGMQDHLTKLVRRLSTGMRQRLAIALALFGDPELLLLDEPSSGLDPEGMASIRGLFLQLKAEGKALVVSSHQLSEVEKLCDEVLILREGQPLYHGPVNQLEKYRDLEEMYLSINKSNGFV